MSLDEARYNFSVDASGSIETNNYMLVGDNAYGYSFSYTNLSSNVIGDLDTYSIHVDIGSNYTVVAGGGFGSFLGTPVNSANFGILDRYGNVLALSTDYGSYSGFTFTALDSIYYIQEYSSSPGFYGMRLENNSIVEQNGLGQAIVYGQTYTAALDYTSDVDIYTAYLQAGNTYYFSIQSSIPDIYLDVEYDQQAVASLVTAGSGLYYFTAGLSGNYGLHISSNKFVNKGEYTLITQPDITAPTVTSFSPTDGAIAVAIGRNINLTFSEAIQTGTGMIAIHTGSANGAIVESFDAATSNRLVFSGSSLTIDPSTDLGNNTQYFLTFDSGSVKDLFGNSYAGATSYDFITAAALDTTPPIVSTFIPADGATGVAVSNNIDLAFNEAIHRGTGNIEIRTGSAKGKVTETFNVATSSNISISDHNLIIDPTKSLSYNTHYFVILASGSIKDLAGNDYQGTTSYDFTTSNTVTTVLSSYTLSAKEPNDLTYIGFSDFKGTGNAKNNTIISGFGNDKLNGGKGVDFLIGGTGNDTYLVDSIKDTIREEINAGTDTVQSSVTFSLTTFVNVENLTLIGTKAIKGNGNDLDNTVIGNTAKNIINGGLGNDILTGGNGKDTFLFNTALNSTLNLDTITDFIHGTDKIQLSRSIMNNLSIGVKLNPLDFKLSTEILDASDRIIYDQNSGSLSYDEDGSGSGAAIQIAIIGVVTHAALTLTDFIVSL